MNRLCDNPECEWHLVASYVSLDPKIKVKRNIVEYHIWEECKITPTYICKGLCPSCLEVFNLLAESKPYW
jgi:hypothetical protein